MPPPLPAKPGANRAPVLTNENIGTAEKLSWLSIITSPLVAGVRNEPAFIGTAIGSRTDKILFYESRWQYPVGLRVVGDPLLNTVRLNFYRDATSDDSFVDYIANTGTVRNETNQIIVLPGQKIYVQNRTGIALTSQDILRKLVVDVATLLENNVWAGLK